MNNYYSCKIVSKFAVYFIYIYIETLLHVSVRGVKIEIRELLSNEQKNYTVYIDINGFQL